MSNLYDYRRWSTYVGALIDRKTRSLSISISTSTLYLKALTDRSIVAEGVSTTKAQEALSSAVDAQSSEDATTLMLQGFTSTYLGVRSTDPSVSSLNLPVLEGAFYVRKADRRLRTAAYVNGALVWTDASVAADRQSIIEEGTTLFLGLDRPGEQLVKGPVEFSFNPEVPDITDWSAPTSPNARSTEKLVRERLRATIPAGTVLMFFGSNAPAGWGICDGSTYQRSDGTGTIVSPDMRGRVPAGPSSTYAVGNSYGALTKTPTTSTNTTGASVAAPKSSVDAGSGAGRVTDVTFSDPGHNHTVEVNVTQPTMTLLFIMKL